MGKTVHGRELPDYIAGWGSVTPFAGLDWQAPATRRHGPPLACRRPGAAKVLTSLAELLRQAGARDGMTFSFHHHFRNGDYVMNMVLAAAARAGLKNLKVAPSGIFPVHAPLVEFIKNGTVTGIDTNYMSGPVAEAVSRGILPTTAVLRTHGGRPRAIAEGSLHIDIAFIAAPTADVGGNITGLSGLAACGSLGYAMPDAYHADIVVAVTDNLVDYPLAPVSIPGTLVDYVVKLDSIGDPQGIVSGTTRITRDPVGLKIAATAADVIAASGLLQDGFSFQTGAGGASLATAYFLRRKMEQAGICGSFIMGGITGYLVDLLEAGLFKRILDVQDFDQRAIQSLAANANQLEISADYYANPHTKGCVVNQLDCVVLGATEIDTGFNVNVVTNSNGEIMGGSGGHADAAAGAKLTIIVTNLLRSRLPIVRDQVTTITTPGETVDVLVTERGVAVNQRRAELRERLRQAGVPVMEIEELKALAEKIAGQPGTVEPASKIVALVEYRDGTVLDVVRQVRD